MTRIASRVGSVVLPLIAAVIAACTGGYSGGGCCPSKCSAPCGCGPSGTYSYGSSSPAYRQPMPNPGAPYQPGAAYPQGGQPGGYSAPSAPSGYPAPAPGGGNVAPSAGGPAPGGAPSQPGARSCGSGQPGAAPGGMAAPAAAPTTAAAQIERGKAAFGQYCAKCHGASGQGSDTAPALVGAGALPLDPPATRKFRKMQFRTAADVGQFVVANMPPPGKGEKPPPEDAWAIVAFAADANGVHPTEVLTPANASSVVLHK